MSEEPRPVAGIDYVSTRETRERINVEEITAFRVQDCSITGRRLFQVRRLDEEWLEVLPPHFAVAFQMRLNLSHCGYMYYEG